MIIAILSFPAAAVIGFEQDVYTANEADGFVTVCVVLIDPSDPLLFDFSVPSILSISDTDDTAEGLDKTITGL